ncbi:MAG: TIR domain-containing protein [Lentimicrobiaceae bacterium]|nr:TIR domain-containing protein [Lentimicrobiaceae bacterium]
MTVIKTYKQFLKWLQPPSETLARSNYFKSNYSVGEEMLHLINKRFRDLDLTKRQFISTEFQNCEFENCEFTSSFITSCTFNNCIFTKCSFTWAKFFESDLIKTQFVNCIIAELELCDVVIEDSVFKDCREILDLVIRGNWNRQLFFSNCYIAFLDIEPIKPENSEILNFEDCIISESSFDRVNFSKSKFTNCAHSLNQFTSCIFSKETLIDGNITSGMEFSFVDLRTILDSDNLPIKVLENIFGIHNPAIKEYIHGLTSKIEFQSIFISYSFKDKEFAQQINNELIDKGIMTFLWEKDSVGGESLKEIMSQSVKVKDRVLFIASKDSLKSSACHFELTEGRKKQELIWDNVLFPIHIDNYLFKVKKDNIRPVEIQEEYWKNITELRNLNSLDFTEFVRDKNYTGNKYENLIYRLVKGLRKGK